jgi:hypothetical protein
MGGLGDKIDINLAYRKLQTKINKIKGNILSLQTILTFQLDKSSKLLNKKSNLQENEAVYQNQQISKFKKRALKMSEKHKSLDD